jgi:hypothetical protein
MKKKIIIVQFLALQSLTIYILLSVVGTHFCQGKKKENSFLNYFLLITLPNLLSLY